MPQLEPVVAGEQWVQAQLVLARPAFAAGAEALAFSTIEEYEASLRAQVAAFLAPVDAYIGRTVADAQRLALDSGDTLCVHRAHPKAHRMYLSARRVHARVEADTVVDAYRDRPGWLTGVTRKPRW